MTRVCKFLTLCVFALAALANGSFAHGPVERESEAKAGTARIFTADAATGEIVVIDLPDGKTVARLSTPPFIMVLGLSADRRHLFAMRGRNTNRDWVTVINTGFESATQEFRPPYVARTILGSAPTTGGIHYGGLANIGGKDAIFMEGMAEIIVFEGSEFTGQGAVPSRRYKLAAADHYHYLEAVGNIYVGHLAQGLVQVVSMESGEEVARIPGCPRLHGMMADEPTGRLFFSCGSHVLIIGTQGDAINREVGRIAYPESQRIASFVKGKDRVYWGSSEGTLPLLYRFDSAREPYALETVPVEDLVQYNVSGDGELLLILTRAGNFNVRDGGTGELMWSVRVTQPFAEDFHEHTDKAILPDILTFGGHAYVSLPDEGRIADIDLEKRAVAGTFEIGGEPTRLVLIEAGG